MLRRSAGGSWLNTVKAQLTQIERIDKDINHANWIALVDEIIETFGQKRRLPAIYPRNKTLHQIPPRTILEYHSGCCVLTQPGSKLAVKLMSVRLVYLTKRTQWLSPATRD